jgi:hypothetical protein
LGGEEQFAGFPFLDFSFFFQAGLGVFLFFPFSFWLAVPEECFHSRPGQFLRGELDPSIVASEPAAERSILID